MKVTCDHCKNEINSCTHCNTGELKKDITFNIVFLIVILIICLTAAYRWYDALDDFERAQRLRRAYLKTKIESKPTLPFTK